MQAIKMKENVLSDFNYDVHYIEKEDYEAHDILLCIQTATNLDDPNRMRFSTDEFYFNTQEEMQQHFIDIPEALENTCKIADECNLEIDFKTKSLLKKKNGNYWDHVIDRCNKEYLEKRKIKVQYYLSPDHVKYIITDEGKGFEWEHYITTLPDGNLINNYHGVGLTMLQDIFNVSFNEKGNEITMIKYFNKG